MSENHFVRVDIAKDGDVTWSIYCNAGEGSDCRLWCKECDEYQGENHDQHELHDQGYCLQTTGWFDDTSLIAESYTGSLQPLRCDMIDLEWQGDYYTWKYAKEVEDYRG